MPAGCSLSAAENFLQRIVPPLLAGPEQSDLHASENYRGRSTGIQSGLELFSSRNNGKVVRYNAKANG
jgi:hypothetical protein